MKRAQRAFTLIELLVVIAIIAILAAILFPVFAEAKSAAKNSKTVSNLKQIGTAFALYQADYDDTYQMAGTMNGNGASWGTGACSAGTFGCPGWDTIMFPYMRNFELFRSDFDRVPTGFSPNWGQVKKSFRVAGNVVRGWAGVNTWDGQDYGWQGTNATSIPAPADTIVVTEQRNPAIYDCTWWPGAWLWECNVWWNRSSNTLSNLDPIAWGTETRSTHRYTAGIDFARAQRANYLFADSHVGSRGVGFIFPGYQQRLNMNSAVDPTLRGVCLDADPFRPNTNDCLLPQ
jgi:prepilin-type N-terminal cleavage/methylation domain-containing protein/prepilin-type processing-associated H-X9-DG protein